MSDTNKKPPIVLTPEAKASLIGLDADMKQAEHLINVMEEMEMDVTALRADLELQRKRREILLREFAD